MSESSQGGTTAGKPSEPQNEALARLDQLAWEAPPLRQVFTREGDREPWANPCPPWCTGEGKKHEIEHLAVAGGRKHESAPLLVRIDGGKGYFAEDEEGREGVYAAHLAVALQAGSRALDRFSIQIVARGGAGAGEPVVNTIPALQPDEVRELIAVLQHLLKVGQEQ